jgi:hypothetical protein
MRLCVMVGAMITRVGLTAHAANEFGVEVDPPANKAALSRS